MELSEETPPVRIQEGTPFIHRGSDRSRSSGEMSSMSRQASKNGVQVFFSKTDLDPSHRRFWMTTKRLDSGTTSRGKVSCDLYSIHQNECDTLGV